MISARELSSEKEIDYEIENGRNYLVTKIHGRQNYIYKMIVRNDIKGIIRAQLRSRDNEEYLFYPVNEMMAMSQMSDIVKFNEERVRNFIQSLVSVTNSMEEYLLPFEGLLIDPSMIYESANGEFKWIYVPSMKKEEADVSEAGRNFENLFSFMLDRVDKLDHPAVQMMYTLYQSSRDAITLGNGREVTEVILREAKKLLGDDTDMRKENIREFNNEEARLIRDDILTISPATPTVSNINNANVNKINNKRISLKTRDEKATADNSSKNLPARVGDDSFKKAMRKVWALLTTDVSFSGKEKKEESEKNYDIEESDFYPEVENVTLNAKEVSPTETVPMDMPGAVNDDVTGQGTFNQSTYQGEDVYFPEGNTPFVKNSSGRRGVFTLQPLDSADEPVLISKFPFFIGKSKENVNATIEDATVSQYHARIDRSDNGIFSLTDLNSTNGSFLNGIRLLPYEKMCLHEGDTVIISRRRYTFAAMA